LSSFGGVDVKMEIFLENLLKKDAEGIMNDEVTPCP
jgi:hypothetical protein